MVFTMNTDDIYVWPDGSWAYKSDVADFELKRNSWAVFLYGSQGYIDFINQVQGDSDVD